MELYTSAGEGCAFPHHEKSAILTREHGIRIVMAGAITILCNYAITEGQ